MGHPVLKSKRKHLKKGPEKQLGTEEELTQKGGEIDESLGSVKRSTGQKIKKRESETLEKRSAGGRSERGKVPMNNLWFYICKAMQHRLSYSPARWTFCTNNNHSFASIFAFPLSPSLLLSESFACPFV